MCGISLSFRPKGEILSLCLPRFLAALGMTGILSFPAALEMTAVTRMVSRHLDDKRCLERQTLTEAHDLNHRDLHY